MKTKLFRILLAAVLLLATVASMAACNQGGGAGGTTGTFNFLTSDFSPYMNKDLLKYTGNIVDLSKNYKEPETYDLAYVEENWKSILRGLQITHREGDGTKVSRSDGIGIGDDIYFYLVSANKKDKTTGELTPIVIPTEPFDTAYYDSPYGPFTVGAEEVYGVNFDEALLGVVPADTYLVKETINPLTVTDVVYLTWSRVNKDDKTDKTATVTDRVDLSKWDAAAAEALVAKFNEKGSPYGSSFTFDAAITSTDEEGNETTNTYTYTATVNFVAKEKTLTLEFQIPGNYYPTPTDKDDASYNIDLALSKLNTETVVFEVILPYMIDYSVADAETVEFYKETLKFETSKTSLEDIVAEYKEHTVQVMNDEVAAQVESWKMENLWKTILGVQSLFADYPADECEIQYDIIYETVYSYWAANYSSYYTIDQYISAAYGYQSFDEYCYYATVGEIGRDMAVYHIYRSHSALAVPKEEMDAAYEEYVANLIEEAEENRADEDDTVYDKQYFEEYYATNYKADYLYRIATRDLIYEAVEEYLLTANTFILESGESKE